MKKINVLESESIGKNEWKLCRHYIKLKVKTVVKYQEKN